LKKPESLEATLCLSSGTLPSFFRSIALINVSPVFVFSNTAIGASGEVTSSVRSYNISPEAYASSVSKLTESAVHWTTLGILRIGERSKRR
nr:hypothetical protein [Tanacetum cinerariifolium]